MANGNDERINALEEKVASLTSLVEKQSKVIANTGKQILLFQVNDVKTKMSQMETKPNTDVDLSDYITNDDIVQLVSELLGQLDALEDRNIGRIYNIQLTEKDTSKKVAPLTNKDGDLPSSDIFPNTVGDYLTIKDAQILQLCEFYELIITNDDKDNINKFIEDGNMSLEEAQKLLQGNSGEANIEKKLLELSSEQINELHDELSRYLGLKFRKSDSLW